MLLYPFVVGFGFLLLAYSIKLLRAPFFSIAENSLSLVNVLLLKIDEDEKVKLVQKKNSQLLISLFKVLLSILISIGIASIPFVIYSFALNLTYSDLEFTSISSILALSIGSTLGFFIPIKTYSTSGYSELSKLLHRLALNNYAIAYKLFKWEVKNAKKNKIDSQDKFVIVSGLARSGTTSIMNKLMQNERFASLGYANMPFLTAPNLWRRLYKPKNDVQKERSHKDGIMIGLDSIEALEEYFFKMISNDSFIDEEALYKYNLTESDYLNYIDYQSIVRKENKRIYLAKNNNFILRYNSIRKFNSNFVIIFMYRDPLSHAASLLEKHLEYTKMQKEDGFILEYMNWLGHHEFGLNQKPFLFNEKETSFLNDKNHIDYWLQIWINYYNYLIGLDKSKLIYVDYDNYCQNPAVRLNDIYKNIGIDPQEMDLSPFINNRKVDYECSQELKHKAYEIYDRIKSIQFSNA